MQQVKRAGGAARADYDPVAAADTRAQIEMANDLRLAIQRGELVLYYQPKVDAASLKITAAEALLRWLHPVQGLISPGTFIPLAERHGLIGALGDWVVSEATRQAGRFEAKAVGLHPGLRPARGAGPSRQPSPGPGRRAPRRSTARRLRG